jgi:ESCRT-II complex subunit VPS22
VEACIATRPINGGLIELPALLRLVQRRRGAQTEPVSEDDIVRAIRKLKVLGGGFDLVGVGSLAFVRSVPGELNTDKNRVLELAHAQGYVSRAGAAQSTGWSRQRVEEVLAALLKEGLAMLDEGAPDGVALYWFPCTSGAAATSA